MIDRSRIAAALLVVGTLLLVAPAVAPVQPFLSHEVQGAITDDPAVLRDRGIDVIAYENLSERGKTLYERTLRNGGSLQVPVGSGAADFEYRLDPETEREAASRPGFDPRMIAIERPADADFPTLDDRRSAERRPPDERNRREAGGTDGAGSASDGGSDGPATATDGSSTDRTDSPAQSRDQERYNLLQTRLAYPPLTDPGNLLRFLSVLAGVVLVGSGGYLRSRP